MTRKALYLFLILIGLVALLIGSRNEYRIKEISSTRVDEVNSSQKISTNELCQIDPDGDIETKLSFYYRLREKSYETSYSTLFQVGAQEVTGLRFDIDNSLLNARPKLLIISPESLNSDGIKVLNGISISEHNQKLSATFFKGLIKIEIKSEDLYIQKEIVYSSKIFCKDLFIGFGSGISEISSNAGTPFLGQVSEVLFQQTKIVRSFKTLQTCFMVLITILLASLFFIVYKIFSLKHPPSNEVTFLSLLLILGISNIYIILVATMGFMYGGFPNWLETISFSAADQPWMPKEASAIQPIVGGHYFGDLISWLGFGQLENAYSTRLPPNSFPFGTFLFKILWHLGLQTYVGAFILYFIIVIFLVWRMTVIASKQKPLWFKFIFFTFGIIFTGPFLIAVDRGSMQLIALGALVSGLVRLARNSTKLWNRGLGIFLCVIAVSLKSYFVLCLIPLIFLKKQKILGSFVLFLSAVNLLVAQVWFGGIAEAFTGLLNASVSMGGSARLPWLFQASSAAGILVKILTLGVGVNETFELVDKFPIIIWIPGIFCLALALIISCSRFHCQWIRVASILSVTQLVVPSSMAYNQIWVLFLLVFLCSDNNPSKTIKEKIGETPGPFLYTVSIFGLFFSLLIFPWKTEISGHHVLWGPSVSAAFWVSFLVVAAHPIIRDYLNSLKKEKISSSKI